MLNLEHSGDHNPHVVRRLVLDYLHLGRGCLGLLPQRSPSRSSVADSPRATTEGLPLTHAFTDGSVPADALSTGRGVELDVSSRETHGSLVIQVPGGTSDLADLSSRANPVTTFY